jgi:predicted acyl esterase
MSRSGRRAARTLALLSALVLLIALGSAGTASAASSLRFFDITASDGVILKANVYEPDASFTGPRPAIVFINSWGLNQAEYLAQAKSFADQGYVVLSYTTRGFYGSGGSIETAGPKDIADVTSAINWLLANTRANPAKIGAAGISYGSGISLLGAAADPRIRAVAAMSTWTDLVFSLFANQTRHFQAAGLLKLAGDLTGHPSAELNATLADFFANRNIPGLTAFAAPRSAKNVVGQINANGPAILMENAYGDSLFAPNQLADFFGQLTTPKRLELRPGDHAIPELTGLLGIQNDAWTSVHRWFDQYLRSVNTGITTENPVVLQLRDSGAYESYPNWGAITTSSLKLGLSDVHWWSSEGDLLTNATQTGWTDSIPGGIDTTANGGVVLLTNGAEALTGDLPYLWVPSVSRLNAGVWQSSYFSGVRRIRGAAKLHLTVTPSNSGQSTVIAYLYDVDVLGNGRLLTHVPYTLRGTTGGHAYTIDTDFPATAYDLPSGHRLSLIVDTVDPLYGDSAPLLSTVKFSSPSGSGSYVSVPLR